MHKALIPELLLSSDVGLRRVVFHRPQVLNALNLKMIRALTPWLHRMEGNSSTQAIVFRGSGDKAFCAGGDIRFLYDCALRGKDDDKALSCAFDFFKEEYRLNYLLSELHTPVISILNGITMGGGVGLSMHGKFVVATEKTVFAMPETAIGFIPDVGGSHLLPRMGKSLLNTKGGPKQGQGMGTYLALTGERVKAEEVAALGLAGHFIKTRDIDRLEQTISGLNLTDELPSDIKVEMIRSALREMEYEDYSQRIEKDFVEKIERIFGADQKIDTVEGILDRLEAQNDDWAEKILKKLWKMSPLSLKVTHELMRRGIQGTLKDCLELEYRVACRMMSNHDFIEGVRAKDRKSVV